MNSPILPRISVSSGVHMWPRTENGPHFPSGQKYIYPTRTQYWNDTEITQIAPTKKCCFLYWNIKQKLTWTVYREWFGLTLHDSLHDSSKLLLRFNWFESTWLAVFFVCELTTKWLLIFVLSSDESLFFVAFMSTPRNNIIALFFLSHNCDVSLQQFCICLLKEFQLAIVAFVGCLTSQQHESVSQGRICTDNFMCCHTEIEVADPTFHLTQSRYTDTGPTSPSTDPITPGAWQGSHWSANF